MSFGSHVKSIETNEFLPESGVMNSWKLDLFILLFFTVSYRFALLFILLVSLLIIFCSYRVITSPNKLAERLDFPRVYLKIWIEPFLLLDSLFLTWIVLNFRELCNKVVSLVSMDVLLWISDSLSIMEITCLLFTFTLLNCLLFIIVEKPTL